MSAMQLKTKIDFFDDEEEEEKEQTTVPEVSSSKPEDDVREEEEEKVYLPFVRFRRVARAVKLLIQVCHVCKGLLADSVSQEAWFALVDNIAAANALTNDKKKGRAFVTFVPNENQELEQLSFDVTEYMRHKKAEVVRCMKNISKAFNEYPLSIQKEICQKAFYDQYGRNRVILRRGLAPDGIYFLLSGELVEKPEGRKQTEEIESGQKFGEEDLICGSSRRATVLSKDDVEILYLHRFDYRVIFNMSSDNCDPKNLDICKNDAVFQHFPMQKLLDNPGTWSALKYKYGRLIVKDSNDIEWIYVIKSGEARVLKHLEPGRVDVKARRKKIQQQMEEQSSYHKKKKILDFVADGTGRKSCYAPRNYHPSTIRRATIPTAAAPAHRNCHSDHTGIDYRLRSQSAFPGQRVSVSIGGSGPPTRPMTTQPSVRHESLDEDVGDKPEATEDTSIEVIVTHNIEVVVEDEHEGSSTTKTKSNASESGGLRRSKQAVGLPVEEGMALPPFVQIETLHPGHTFVSGDCEVLAINKKFFMKHCDDALFSLIRLKAKAFPTQTELVDRLDANMQWEEFKQETLKYFLQRRTRHAR
ncbi:CNBD2-like protein [Mya arenaria]|uniref:CNBD2-like protein n=1 Tax=Mya arenaria TaxID=6604 RepID=A0ABY7DTT6_MYAAR|nr:CNBD2-like protein [Mya arenaria]WAR00504.1 CNBD2-like protein [Mya arenaria]